MPDSNADKTAQQVDAIIIGSGQGGNPLAGALAGKGWSVALIESKHVGGTCVNEGCTPTKTMIASAKVAYQARHGHEYGIETSNVTVDMAEVRERKRRVVDVWRSGSEKRLESEAHIELVFGTGRFISPNEIEVALNEGGTSTFTADHIFINTGLRSYTPPNLGLDKVPFLTNETIMELDTVPEHLLILGGSYIAVEFAQMFRRFGAQVTIVNKAAQLLPREDPDIAECMAEILEQDGIRIKHNTTATAAGRSGDCIALTLETEDGQQTVSGSHLLLAAGRTPNTDALNLAAAGLKADEHGFLPVNERLQTSVKGIYAIGDVKGGPAFTHISYDDYRILAANLLENGSRTTMDRPVPYTVFTDPELGRIGMTEAEARKTGRKIKIAKMPASSIARAYETGEDRGLMKVLVDEESKLILGAAVLAGQGGELAAMLQIAMAARMPYTELRDAVWAHPTWAEALNNIFFAWQEE